MGLDPEEPMTLEPNPKWPAFRDELDADVKAAVEKGDIRGWIVALRRRMTFGGVHDSPKRIEVPKPFHELLMADIRERDELALDLFSVSGGIRFKKVPVVVEETREQSIRVPPPEEVQKSLATTELTMRTSIHGPPGAFTCSACEFEHSGEAFAGVIVMVDGESKLNMAVCMDCEAKYGKAAS